MADAIARCNTYCGPCQKPPAFGAGYRRNGQPDETDEQGHSESRTFFPAGTRGMRVCMMFMSCS